MLSSRWAPAIVAAVVTSAFAIWKNGWWGGLSPPANSGFSPPLAALLTPVWVGAASAVASAHLFDGLVRARWGEGARWAGLWFAALGSVALLANGWLVFALGTAFALGSLRAL